MENSYLLRDMTERAICLSLEAAAQGAYSAAYFALLSAWQCAILLPDNAGLAELRLTLIDVRANTCRRATQAAPLGDSIDVSQFDQKLTSLVYQIDWLMEHRRTNGVVA